MRLDAPIGFGIANLDGVAQHILWQREHDRSLTSGGGGVKGVAHIFRDAPGIIDLPYPFGELTVHAPKIDLLEGLSVDGATRRLTDQ